MTKSKRQLDEFDLAAAKEGVAIRQHNTLRSTPIKGKRMVGAQRTLARYKAQILRFPGFSN